MAESGEFGGFGDAESQSGGYGNKDAKLTYPFLVLEQVRRCAKAGSVEFRGGYMKETPVLVGAGSYTVRDYVPASHETFSESVITLANMLSGYFDKEASSAYTAFKTQVSEKKKSMEDWSQEKSQPFSFEEFMFVRSRLARTLFAELCKFLKRINFMEGSGVEEGLVDEQQ